MSNDPFAARHRLDRAFFAGFVAISWLAILAGFAESVQQRLDGHADYPAPLILVLHVFVFTAWMLLLTVQVALVGAGRASLHRTLGIAGLLLVPMMIVTGFGAEIFSQRFYTPKYPGNAAFFIAPVVEMGMFAVAAALAFQQRHNAPRHKRLMLIATSMILAAAFNRWWGQPIYGLMGDGFWGMLLRTFLGPDLLILLAVLYDLLTRRRVHPVFMIAMPLIIAAELATSMIYHSPVWPPLVRAMLGL